MWVEGKQRTNLALLGGAAILIAFVSYGIARGGADDGETAIVTRGLIHRVIAGKGTIEPRAEVRITANMIGRIKAILVDEGDEVRPGQLLVQMDDAELRAQVAQAEARLDEARARQAELEAGARPQELGSMRAREREADAVLAEATGALERSRVLFQNGLIARAQLDEAQGRHAVAAAQHQSAREQLSLLEAGTRDEVKQAMVAQVKRAEADLRLARASLDQTVIRSPVAGRVVRRSMEPGEVIMLQRPEPILILADTSHTRVRAEVDETDAQFLKTGQSAEITSEALPGRIFKGTVTEVGAMVGRKSLQSDDPAERVDTKVVEVIIELLGDHRLTWGVSAEVALIVEHRENVPVIPRSAVRTEDGMPTVMVRKGRSDSERAVRIGASDDDYVEVLEGLKEGEIVVRH